MIGAINMYLQAYHMYMAQELNKPEVRRLDTMSRDALDTLQKNFAYGVRRLYWCTEKPHSMVHWASNRRNVGPGRNRYALCALESCRIPRFLLGLLALVGDFMQTLHLIEKVCIKSACQIFADMQTFAKSA